MTFYINLSKEQSEQLILIYRMVNDPDITCIEDYVESLVEDLLTRVWNDVRSKIMN